MRSDMAKVIVERPRKGGGLKSPKGEYRRLQKIPLDEQPNREKIRRKWISNYSGKELNEHLRPLYRWLRSKIGQPWDKVYAEICEHISIDSAVQSHVRDHVDIMVEKSIIMVDGRACQMGGYAHLIPLDSYYRDQFYVHPITKLLCVAPIAKRRKNSTNQDILQKGKNIQYHRINGIWYELTMVKKDDMKRKSYAYDSYAYDYRHTGYDLAYKTCFANYDADRLYGNQLRPIKKRQLNSKEITALKV